MFRKLYVVDIIESPYWMHLVPFEVKDNFLYFRLFLQQIFMAYEIPKLTFAELTYVHHLNQCLWFLNIFQNSSTALELVCALPWGAEFSPQKFLQCFCLVLAIFLQ